MKDKLIIIDGNSLINRAFYALPLLSNSRGEFSNGVYGFANILIKAILEVKPKYIAVALDFGKKTFRNEMFKEYKGTRKPTPEELKSQFPILKEMLKAMNVAFIEKQNFEADDILGTLTKLYDTQNIIITGDRDALQLINENTEVWLTKKGITEVKSINDKNFFAEYSLNPDQIVDLKALMGDSSDNIPGVKGVGEKTALELMKTYNSLDGVYENVENVKGKLKEKLLESKEMAYLSKKLATIKTNVPLGVTLKDLEYTFPFKNEVVEFFEFYDFNSLLKRTDLFNEIKIDKTFEKYNANKLEITTTEMLEKQLNYVKKAKRFNFDIDEQIFSFAYDKNCEFFINFSSSNALFEQLISNESKLKQKAQNKESLISQNSQADLFSQIDHPQKIASTDKNNETILNISSSNKSENFVENNQKISAILQYFAPIFEDNSIKKCLFDSKLMQHFLKDYANLTLKGVDFDAILAQYLLVVGVQNASRENLLLNYKLSKEYNSLNLFYLKEFLEKDLEEAKLTDLYFKIEFPLINVLFEMENVGFNVDPEVLKDLKSRYETETFEMENTIKRLAFGNSYIEEKNKSFEDEKENEDEDFLNDEEDVKKFKGSSFVPDESEKNLEKEAEKFNINSPKQLANLLFDKLKLKVFNNKKRSTSMEVLEELYDMHPIIPAIIRYRKIKKILTTYVEPYEKIISKHSSLVHTCFNQTLTATGRLSSSEPNLQNIPVRDDEGKNLRKIFVTRYENGVLVSSDYSQIELRLLAHLSQDEKLIDAFNNNIDIHSLTASEVFHCDIKDVTPKMRRMAKAVNFGIIYGISEYGLSQNIGTSRKKAKLYIEEYFEHYPKIKKYMENNVKMAKESGYAYSIFGRRRKVDELLSPNFNTRQFGERVAMNMPLQGSASDIIKLAMINVDKSLKDNNLQSRLILQVHDELIIDAPLKEISKVSKILKDEMENAVKLSVPLTVEVDSGKTWFDC
ncbi:MAG: DNA polymerase I [Clostridia bacterium]|nr:DNA polymerase I [Clostridia bacterium]